MLSGLHPQVQILKGSMLIVKERNGDSEEGWKQTEMVGQYGQEQIRDVLVCRCRNLSVKLQADKSQS